MGRVAVILMFLAGQPLAPEAPEPAPLTSWELARQAPEELLLPWAWGIATVGGTLSVGLTAWGLGTALSALDSPDGPPVQATGTALAWGTMLFALAGIALDYAFTASAPMPPSDPE